MLTKVDNSEGTQMREAVSLGYPFDEIEEVWIVKSSEVMVAAELTRQFNKRFQAELNKGQILAKYVELGLTSLTGHSTGHRYSAEQQNWLKKYAEHSDPERVLLDFNRHFSATRTWTQIRKECRKLGLQPARMTAQREITIAQEDWLREHAPEHTMAELVPKYREIFAEEVTQSNLRGYCRIRSIAFRRMQTGAWTNKEIAWLEARVCEYDETILRSMFNKQFKRKHDSKNFRNRCRDAKVGLRAKSGLTLRPEKLRHKTIERKELIIIRQMRDQGQTKEEIGRNLDLTIGQVDWRIRKGTEIGLFEIKRKETLWTSENIRILSDLENSGMKRKEICRSMGLLDTQIQRGSGKARALGLIRRRHDPAWTQAEREITLRMMENGASWKEIVEALPGRRPERVEEGTYRYLNSLNPDRPKRSTRRWKEEDFQIIYERYTRGDAIEDIARSLERTTNSLRKRITNMRNSGWEMPIHGRRTLTEEECQTLISAYKAGESFAMIAKTIGGCTPNNIGSYLKRLGRQGRLKLRHKARDWTPEQRHIAIKMLGRGYTAADVGRMAGRTMKAVQAMALGVRAGRIPGKGARRRWTMEEERQLIQLRRSRLPWTTIVTQFDRTEEAVRKRYNELLRDRSS